MRRCAAMMCVLQLMEKHLRRLGQAQGYGILTRSRHHISKQVALEPAGEGADKTARALNAQSAALRLPETQVAAPPGDKGSEWAVKAERLGIAGIMIA